MPKRLTSAVHLTPTEYDRLQRLDALTKRAVDLIGDAGEIDYPAAMIVIRALADERTTP